MDGKSVKSLLVLVFSLLFVISSPSCFAQEHNDHSPEKKETEKSKFDANEVIFGHVLDNYEFHFLTYEGKGGEEHHVSIPLPVILYSVDRSKLSVFSSSRFHHGHEEYEGYKRVGNKIISTQTGEKFYDFSLTRNVVQMILALIILVWIMISIANRYKKGEGVTSAPKGMQGFFEPIITFVRDDVAKPNLGNKYMKYMPYLLTVFFFILINNIFGLIPGTANVTGNIAFTLVLGVISFIVILFSTTSNLTNTDTSTNCSQSRTDSTTSISPGNRTQHYH